MSQKSAHSSLPDVLTMPAVLMSLALVFLLLAALIR